MMEGLTKKNHEIRAAAQPDARAGCRYPIACVVMAAGIASRYQAPDPALVLSAEDGGEKAGRGNGRPDNKLTADFKGKPVLSWVLDVLAELDCAARVVVIRAEETAELIPSEGFCTVWNNGTDTSPSKTIRCGLRAIPADVEGCLFSVGDQPQVTGRSLEKLCDAFLQNPEKIVMLSWKGRPGNPVIFPASLFGELTKLGDGQSGKVVIRRHPDRVICVEAEAEAELRDIDTKADLREAQT